MLEREYAYFSAHIDEFLKEHSGEYVIIIGEEVQGFTKTEEDAIVKTADIELGTFLIKHVTKDALKPQEFHSRVVFA